VATTPLGGLLVNTFQIGWKVSIANFLAENLAKSLEISGVFAICP
jgi:hypothetical protein